MHQLFLENVTFDIGHAMRASVLLAKCHLFFSLRRLRAGGAKKKDIDLIAKGT